MSIGWQTELGLASGPELSTLLRPPSAGYLHNFRHSGISSSTEIGRNYQVPSNSRQCDRDAQFRSDNTVVDKQFCSAVIMVYNKDSGRNVVVIAYVRHFSLPTMQPASPPQVHSEVENPRGPSGYSCFRGFKLGLGDSFIRFSRNVENFATTAAGSIQVVRHEATENL